MKRSRFNEERIVGILKEHQAGISVADLCRKHRGMEVSNARKFRALEGENAKLTSFWRNR